MAEALFRLIVSGDLFDGKRKPDVIRNLARLFKIAPEQAARLVAGKPVPINRQFNKDNAVKFCTQIRNAGAKCAIVPLQAKTNAGPKTPATGVLVCGKCNFKQPASDTCRNCGASLKPGHENEKERTPMSVIVGERYYDYYKAVFKKFEDKDDRFTFTFNKFAFLLTLIWFINRQMYMPAFLIGLMYAFFPTPMVLLIHLGAGVAGNYIYFKHLKKKLAHIKRPSDKLLEELGQNGGLSPRPIAIASIFSFVMIMGYLFYDNIRLLQVWLSTDHQAMRTNQILAEKRDERAALENQDQQLVFLASSIKNKYDYHLALNSLEKPPPDRQDLIERYSMDLGTFKDGWGTLIKYRPLADGFMLISAGEDKKHGTMDDIRHTEPLPYIPKPLPTRRSRPTAGSAEVDESAAAEAGNGVSAPTDEVLPEIEESEPVFQRPVPTR